MAQPVCRLGDMSSGCGCCGPMPAITPGSTNVIINGKPVITVGVLWNVHGCSDCSHPMMTIKGNPKVLVNGKPIVRMGDSLSDGAVTMAGSNNVIG